MTCTTFPCSSATSMRKSASVTLGSSSRQLLGYSYEPPNVSPPKVGDWVRILAGPHIGRRAKVVEVSAERVVMQVSPGAAKSAGTTSQVVTASGSPLGSVIGGNGLASLS